MAFTLLATSLFVIFLCVFPLGKAHSCLAFINIVEDSPVVRPGILGTVVTVKTANARIAAIVRIAESKKATKAGAKEIHLLSVLSDKRRQSYDFFA